MSSQDGLAPESSVNIIGIFFLVGHRDMSIVPGLVNGVVENILANRMSGVLAVAAEVFVDQRGT